MDISATLAADGSFSSTSVVSNIYLDSFTGCVDILNKTNDASSADA